MNSYSLKIYFKANYDATDDTANSEYALTTDSDLEKGMLKFYVVM